MSTNMNTNALTLEDAIERALGSLANATPASDEYARVVDQLAKLYKMKEIENNEVQKHRELDQKANELAQEEYKDTSAVAHKDEELKQKQQELDQFDRVSMTTWATIGANIIGIVAIMSHERTHIIATKALGFVSKLK